MNSLPRLGLLVAADPPGRTKQLLWALRAWCLPQVAEPEEQVAAWLLTSLRAPGAEKTLAAATPVAIWASDAREAAAAAALGPPVVVIVGEEHGLVDDERVVVFPPGLDVRRFLAMTPFVRARWRMRLGLPAHMVVGVGAPDDGLSEDVVPTALALASAVAVGGGWLLPALAWGAPCATDAASAAAVGAAPDVEVVIGEPQRLRELAGQLAADERKAAALGRAARRLVERRHDTSRPPVQVAEKLGLLGPGGSLTEQAAARLSELWTPATAPVVGRVRAALRSLEVT